MRTIYAVATPAGRAALAVIRIAGPQARQVLRILAPDATFVPRRARLTNLYGPHHEILDQALVTYFQRPHSFNGDDIAELHLHGSPAVSRAVLSAIGRTKLAQYAEPGEFTRRAFAAGKLDLAQVEGIRDLLAAETEMQRQIAVSTAAGRLSEMYESWRSQIIQASAVVTAAIDFGEDNALDDGSLVSDIRTRISMVLTQVRLHTRAAKCAELSRDGIRVTLLGAPNAGKSSLTNRLVARSASLVSDVPGTTRDVVEVALDIAGHKVILSDTAGLRESEDTVESLGIARAREVLDEAHIVVALHPPDAKADDPTVLAETERLRAKGTTIIDVTSKSDLSSINIADRLLVSTATGEGIDALTEEIAKASAALVIPDEGGAGVGASERTRNLLETAVIPGLEQSLEFVSNDLVCAAAELSLAIEGIGKITGRGVALDEVLDVVFEGFCIGK